MLSTGLEHASVGWIRYALIKTIPTRKNVQAQRMAQLCATAGIVFGWFGCYSDADDCLKPHLAFTLFQILAGNQQKHKDITVSSARYGTAGKCVLVWSRVAVEPCQLSTIANNSDEVNHTPSGDGFDDLLSWREGRRGEESSQERNTPRRKRLLRERSSREKLRFPSGPG